MAKHEFGIMTQAPQPGKRYDEYEPWKYACLSVDDDYLAGGAEPGKALGKDQWVIHYGL